MENTMTIQELIDALNDMLKNTTVMPTTSTNVSEVVVDSNGLRKVLLQSTCVDCDEYEAYIEKLEGECQELRRRLDDAEEKLANLTDEE